jgi:hypothetical protein
VLKKSKQRANGSPDEEHAGMIFVQSPIAHFSVVLLTDEPKKHGNILNGAKGLVQFKEMRRNMHLL